MSDISNLAALAAAAITKAGGGAYVARVFGLPKTTVQSWKGSRIPDVYAIRVARLAKLRPEQVRPDIFAPAAAAPAVHADCSSDDTDLVGSASVVGSRP